MSQTLGKSWRVGAKPFHLNIKVLPPHLQTQNEHPLAPHPIVPSLPYSIFHKGLQESKGDKILIQLSLLSPHSSILVFKAVFPLHSQYPPLESLSHDGTKYVLFRRLENMEDCKVSACIWIVSAVALHPPKLGPKSYSSRKYWIIYSVQSPPAHSKDTKRCKIFIEC